MYIHTNMCKNGKNSAQAPYIHVPSVCASDCSSEVVDDDTGERVDTLEALGGCFPVVSK